MKSKKVKIAFQITLLIVIICTLFVEPDQFVELKIYYSMIGIAWIMSSILLMIFEDSEKGSRWSSFLLGIAAAACLLPFSGWVVLTLVANFGGHDWLVNYHLSREDFFSGYWAIIFSWPALIVGGIFMLFSCLLGAQPEPETPESQTPEGDQIAARLKEVQEFEGTAENIQLMVDGKLEEEYRKN